MAVVFDSVASVLAAEGQALGSSDWVTISQERINQFADATDDHQWIHVDPDKAADGPFGATIAHGYLTLSLVSRFLPELAELRNLKMGVNYGTNKVRFPNAVKVNSRIRAHGEMVEAQEVTGGVQAVIRVTIEIEGEDKPACVADAISRYFFQ